MTTRLCRDKCYYDTSKQTQLTLLCDIFTSHSYTDLSVILSLLLIYRLMQEEVTQWHLHSFNRGRPRLDILVVWSLCTKFAFRWHYVHSTKLMLQNRAYCSILWEDYTLTLKIIPWVFPLTKLQFILLFFSLGNWEYTCEWGERLCTENLHLKKVFLAWKLKLNSLTHHRAWRISALSTLHTPGLHCSRGFLCKALLLHKIYQQYNSERSVLLTCTTEQTMEYNVWGYCKTSYMGTVLQCHCIKAINLSWSITQKSMSHYTVSMYVSSCVYLNCKWKRNRCTWVWP